LLLPNGPEAAVGFLATSAICVCAPLNFVCTANELDAALSHLKAKVLIASRELDAEKRAVAVKHGISVITATPALKREAGVFTLSASATGRGADDVLPRPNDVALLLHTSGTTSQPKCVGLTHEHLCRSAENIARALQLSPEDRCLNVMPLFHIHRGIPEPAWCVARDSADGIFFNGYRNSSPLGTRPRQPCMPRSWHAPRNMATS